MKNTTCIFLSLALVFSLLLTGCGAKKAQRAEADTSALTALSEEDLLTQLDTDSGAEIDCMPLPVTQDDVTWYLGVKPETFSEKVDSAAVSIAGISAVAHMTAIVNCKDAEAAAAIQAEIVDGFNFYRWICVTPEAAKVTICGNYVYFVASSTEDADKYIAAFQALAGEANVGDVTDLSEQNAGSQAMLEDGWDS